MNKLSCLLAAMAVSGVVLGVLSQTPREAPVATRPERTKEAPNLQRAPRGNPEEPVAQPQERNPDEAKHREPATESPAVVSNERRSVEDPPEGIQDERVGRGMVAHLAKLRVKDGRPVAGRTDEPEAGIEPGRDPGQGRVPRPIPQPVVFQVPLQTLALDAAQYRSAIEVQNQFVDELGYDRDPEDPAYAEDWTNATLGSDALLRAKLGTQGYLSYQLAAARQAYVEKYEKERSSAQP